MINAIKHNPEGCSLNVSLERSGDFARVVVSDTGRGIPPEVLPHIFDRFYREDRARSRTTGGSGLGLSIAKAIVEAHGGTITVTSTVGNGTLFAINLPLLS